MCYKTFLQIGVFVIYSYTIDCDILEIGNKYFETFRNETLRNHPIWVQKRIPVYLLQERYIGIDGETLWIGTRAVCVIFGTDRDRYKRSRRTELHLQCCPMWRERDYLPGTGPSRLRLLATCPTE